MRDQALEYVRGGLSVIPIKTNGTKAPDVLSLNTYKSERRPTEAEVEEWFGGDQKRGIGIICGRLSGSLLVFDFETKEVFQKFREMIESDGVDLSEMPVVETPRGFHLYVKTIMLQGGKKLAMSSTEQVTIEGKDGKTITSPQCLIETRGDGQYVVGPGSPKECHRHVGIERGWDQVSGNEPHEAPVVSDDILQAIERTCRSFNEVVVKEIKNRTGMSEVKKDDHRPGSEYCKQATMRDWFVLLEKYGWSLLREDKSGRQIWQRPGKEREAGGSATLGYCTTSLGHVLYVFSSNAAPFEAETCYSIFAARALLEFNGDFGAAAGSCLREGYGSTAPDDVIQDVGKEIETLKKLETEPTYTKATDQMVEMLCAGSLKMRKLWKRTRVEFKDDPLRYDAALLYFGYNNLGNPTTSGILQGIRLVRRWRQFHQVEPGKALDVQYMAGKVAWLRSLTVKNEEKDAIKSMDAADKQKAKEAQAVEEAKAKSKETPEMRLAFIGQGLGFPVISLIQSGKNIKEATVTMVLEGGQRVNLGNISVLQRAKDLEAALMAYRVPDGSGRTTGIPGFSGCLSQTLFSKEGWRVMQGALYRAIEPEQDEDPEIGIVDSASLWWLIDYLDGHSIFDSPGGEDRSEEAIRSSTPFLRDGEVFVTVDGFRLFLANKGEARLTVPQSYAMMRSIGLRTSKSRIHFDDPGGGRRTRRYWSMRLGILTEAREAGDARQRGPGGDAADQPGPPPETP